jgi:hypothetical protein
LRIGDGILGLAALAARPAAATSLRALAQRHLRLRRSQPRAAVVLSRTSRSPAGPVTGSRQHIAMRANSGAAILISRNVARRGRRLFPSGRYRPCRQSLLGSFATDAAAYQAAISEHQRKLLSISVCRHDLARWVDGLAPVAAAGFHLCADAFLL